MDLRDLRKQVVRLVPACSSHYVECLKDPDIYYNKDTFEVSLKATHDTETAIAAILFVANLKPKYGILTGRVIRRRESIIN